MAVLRGTPIGIMWKTTSSGETMTLHIQLIPLLSILAGILVLVKPKLLNYVVAIYLIAIGVIQLLGISI